MVLVALLEDVCGNCTNDAGYDPNMSNFAEDGVPKVTPSVDGVEKVTPSVDGVEKVTPSVDGVAKVTPSVETDPLHIHKANVFPRSVTSCPNSRPRFRGTLTTGYLKQMCSPEARTIL